MLAIRKILCTYQMVDATCQPFFTLFNLSQFNFFLNASLDNIFSQFVGNNAKRRISKRVFPENKARQIFRKKNFSHTWRNWNAITKLERVQGYKDVLVSKAQQLIPQYQRQALYEGTFTIFTARTDHVIYLQCKMQLYEGDQGSFIWYVHKIFRKTKISYPLIRTHDVCISGGKKCQFFVNFSLRNK